MKIKSIEPIAVSLPMKKPAQMSGETVARAENGFSVREIKCAQILYGLNRVEPFLAKPLPMSSIEDGGKSGRQSMSGRVAFRFAP